MTLICCPFESISIIGGVVVGGTAFVDIVSDPWDGMTMVQPLNEVSTGVPGELIDRTRNHFNGQGGRVLLSGEAVDTTTLPTIDIGVFCQPSQHFDGRQLISLDQDNLTDNHEFTISLWTKFETFHKSRTFYSRGFTDGNGNKYVITFGHSFLNTLSVSVHTQAPAEDLTFGSSTLTPGTWYHVAVTYRGNTLKLYVNGAAVATKVLANDLIGLGDGCMLAATDFTANLQGNLSEVRLHPVARSANWLACEYKSFCDYFVTEGVEEDLFYS